MNTSYVATAETAASAEAMARRKKIRKILLRKTKIKENNMTKETLQEFVNKQVKIVDAFDNTIKGTLVSLTDDSAIIQTTRSTIVVSLDFIARVVVKNQY